MGLVDYLCIASDTVSLVITDHALRSIFLIKSYLFRKAIRLQA